jgi:aconitate hydratase 2 / 2-methylisocitrate dehydratase
MLEAYRAHVAERAAEGIVPKPLSAAQVAELIELLKNPPAGEGEFIVDLISNRVPAGVDEAAYVKAGFLSAVAKGEVNSPLIDRALAVKLLGTMLGGYNISTLVEMLEDAELGPNAHVRCLPRCRRQGKGWQRQRTAGDAVVGRRRMVYKQARAASKTDCCGI